jgi:hypothetical protein
MIAMTSVVFCSFVGGVVVSLFAILGDTLKPKSFAGLFGAAPSVALATLGLTIDTGIGQSSGVGSAWGLCGTQKPHRPRISFKNQLLYGFFVFSFPHRFGSD